MNRRARLARLKIPFAIAVAAVATQGCDKGGLGGDAPDAGGAGVASALNGRWAMFRWEDPVAVEISEAAGVIQGRGCCGGFTQQSTDLNCCGPLTGQIVDRHASFGFSFDYAGSPYDYATDVFVSADRTRMTGTFMTGATVAWVKIGNTDGNLPFFDADFRTITDAHSGDYVLTLADAATAGSDFSAVQTYRIGIGGGYVWGGLGAFWSHEITWSDADQTMVVGPVPETAPASPVALSLHFDSTGAALASVDATMASGARYHFQATPYAPP
jgi:hypothetical protein